MASKAMTNDTAAAVTGGRRSLPFRLLTLAAAALLLFGIWQGWKHFFGKNGRDQYIYAEVQRGDIEDLVSATGALQPRDYVDVGAQVSGQLRKIGVEVGTEVKEGDLLAEIDAEQSNARVDASRAQLRSQQAQLVDRETQLEKAERDLKRQQNLMAEEATTTETLQNAETTLNSTKAQIAVLKATMQQLQASMRVDEANLKFTRIYAPMSGTVVSITAKQGQTLNTNQQAPIILRIADLSTMLVQTQVSEADVSKLRKGMQAYFTTLGSQTRRWYGQLTKIEPTPTVTNNVVLYNALFEVQNSNQVLLPQMTAQVFFVIAEARDVLYVPMSALTLKRPTPPAARAADAAAAPGSAPAASDRRPREGRPRDGQPRRERDPNAAPMGAGGAGQGDMATRLAARHQPRPATVRVAMADGSVQEREVTIGVSNRVHAEILKGLELGERVVAGVKQVEKPGGSGQQGNALGQPPGPPGGFGGQNFPGAGRR